MTWFKVDDDLPFHQKVVRAGNAAMGLWVRAGAWSSQQLTDGFVPDNIVAMLGTPPQRRKLISERLWIEVDGGCQFHQWNENGRQPTSESVRESRAKAAQRQQEYRDRKTGRYNKSEQVNAASDGVTDPSVTPSVTASVTPSVTPAPTRPDPTRSTSGHPAQERPVSERANARAERTPAERALDRVGNAHSTDAHRIITAWTRDLRRRPPAQVISKLAGEVDVLLAEQQWTEDEITAGLREWNGRHGIGPAVLPSVMHELFSSDDPDRAVPIPKDADAPLSDEQVLEILGPAEMDYPPLEVCEEGSDAMRAWARKARPAWLERRREEARDVLRRRAAMRAG